MRLLPAVLFLSGSLYILSPSFNINFYASAAEAEVTEGGDNLDDDLGGDLEGLLGDDAEGGAAGGKGAAEGAAAAASAEGLSGEVENELLYVKEDDDDAPAATPDEKPSTSGEETPAAFVDLVNETVPPPAKAPLPLQTKAPQGPKIKDWNQWMKQAKKDFSGYKGTMHTQRHEWTKEKEDELQKFCKYLEKRWMNYTGNIDRECRSDFLKSTQNWNESQWNKWVKSEGKHHMNKQFQKWLDYNKYKLQDWTNTEWNKWKTTVKEQLDDEEWKKKEAAGKTKEWIKCTDKMEKKCLKKTKKHCKNWEKKANSSFKKWEGDFTKKWTSNKQWNSWCKELEK